jgi:hypothetical protein
MLTMIRLVRCANAVASGDARHRAAKHPSCAARIDASDLESQSMISSATSASTRSMNIVRATANGW